MGERFFALDVRPVELARCVVEDLEDEVGCNTGGAVEGVAADRFPGVEEQQFPDLVALAALVADPLRLCLQGRQDRLEDESSRARVLSGKREKGEEKSVGLCGWGGVQEAQQLACGLEGKEPWLAALPVR